MPTVAYRYLNLNDCCVLSCAKQNDDVLALHLELFRSLLSWIAICPLGFQEAPQKSSKPIDLS